MYTRKNKKAFGDAVSALIMFIAMISVTTGVVILFKNYVVDTQQGFSTQTEITSNKLRSSISISNIYYNVSSNYTYVYVKNIGETKLVTGSFDLYVDNAYLLNFNTTYPSNFSRNLSVLSPQDTVVLIKKVDLTTGSHEVKVLTEFGVSAKEFFNI